jgi:hypothetical protein
MSVFDTATLRLSAYARESVREADSVTAAEGLEIRGQAAARETASDKLAVWYESVARLSVTETVSVRVL